MTIYLKKYHSTHEKNQDQRLNQSQFKCHSHTKAKHLSHAQTAGFRDSDMRELAQSIPEKHKLEKKTLKKYFSTNFCPQLFVRFDLHTLGIKQHFFPQFLTHVNARYTLISTHLCFFGLIPPPLYLPPPLHPLHASALLTAPCPPPRPLRTR